jgi:hypothetical protein
LNGNLPLNSKFIGSRMASLVALRDAARRW